MNSASSLRMAAEAVSTWGAAFLAGRRFDVFLAGLIARFFAMAVLLPGRAIQAARHLDDRPGRTLLREQGGSLRALSGSVKRTGARCCWSIRMSPLNCSVRMSPHGDMGDLDDEPQGSAAGRAAEGGAGREDQQWARRPSGAHERPAVSTVEGAIHCRGTSRPPAPAARPAGAPPAAGRRARARGRVAAEYLRRLQRLPCHREVAGGRGPRARPVLRAAPAAHPRPARQTAAPGTPGPYPAVPGGPDGHPRAARRQLLRMARDARPPAR